MVFKLVRVDGSEPCKIPLPVGTHIVGRGKFLDCSDMRVSRNHGILEVTEDTVILKSLHTNPCFYTKKSLNETQIIKQEETVSLFNGDKFGLVPDSYWYELLLCHIDEFPLKNPAAVSKEKVSETNEEKEDNFENNTEPVCKESCVKETENIDTKALNKDLNVTMESPETPDSPSMLAAEEQQSTIVEQSLSTVAEEEPSTAEELQPNTIIDEQPSTSAVDKQLATSAAESNQADESTQPLLLNRCEIKTQIKRSHSSSEGSSSEKVKKIKKEPDCPEDVKPGPSNDTVSPPKIDGNDKAAAPANPPGPLRERCMYGANCYRKNVHHKAQFSHPSDPDWGPGERGACPWGRACRRRDARHWRDHSHPPGVHQPDQRPGKGRKRKKIIKDSEEDSTDSTSADLIVTEKRVRKTINRSGYSDTNSDSNEDPFQTDESDEWQPPSDVTESQDYSQYSQD